MGMAVQIESLWNGLTDTSGDPLASGKVYTYEPGTTTDKTTWTDQAKATPAANPIILDSAGKAEIWADGVYDLDIDDSSDSDIATISSAVYLLDNGTVTWAATSGGSSSAFTLTPAPALGAYDAGVKFGFIANHSSTGASTLNVSGLGTKAIQLRDGSALSSGDIVSGSTYEVVYNGTAFNLLTGVSEGAIQNSTYVYATSGGSSSDYTLTVSPAITAYAAGQRFIFKANHLSDDTCTLNVSGLGAKNIVDHQNLPLITECIQANQIVDVVYDGTAFRTACIRSSPWVSSTPTIANDGGSASLNIDTSTFRYRIYGSTCEWSVTIQVDITVATTDFLDVTNPITMETSPAYVGSGYYRPASSGAFTGGGHATAPDGTSISLYRQEGTGAAWPIANNQFLRYRGSFEMA